MQNRFVKHQRMNDEELISSQLALSRRHRSWGWDVPMLDIDFLVVEYDAGTPKAMIEYKDIRANICNSGHPSYRALRFLCNATKLPLFAVRYSLDFSHWRVIPINAFAVNKIKDTIELHSESDFVQWLYKLRGRDMPDDLFD